MTHEQLLAEVQRLSERCARLEAAYLRSKEGAQSARVGLRRALAREYRARCDLILANAEAARLRLEAAENKKKIERLSLKILSLWGSE